MKIPKATVTAVLYKSKTLASGEHPVMIRVCYNSKRRYKSTGLSCPAKWWNAAKQEVRERHPLAPNMNAIIGSELTALKNKVLDFEAARGCPTPCSAYSRLRCGNPRPGKPMYDLFEERIAYFRDTLQKHNTAAGYQTLLHIVERFSQHRTVELFDVDGAWLRRVRGVPPCALCRYEHQTVFQRPESADELRLPERTAGRQSVRPASV